MRQPLHRTTEVTLATPDGPLRTRFARPSSGTGPWPAVIFCMDAGGLRASLDGMMQRIADGGYVVAGLTGYCMGGNVVLRAAAIFGERIAAVASFHSAGLATDAPDSPHLGAAKIRTEVLVVGAIEDPTLTAEMRERLRAALQAAGVVHTVTTYPGRHGFAVPGVSAYDRECSERHFAELGALLARRLSTATP